LLFILSLRNKNSASFNDVCTASPFPDLLASCLDRFRDAYSDQGFLRIKHLNQLKGESVRSKLKIRKMCGTNGTGTAQREVCR